MSAREIVTAIVRYVTDAERREHDARTDEMIETIERTRQFAAELRARNAAEIVR